MYLTTKRFQLIFAMFLYMFDTSNNSNTLYEAEFGNTDGIRTRETKKCSSELILK